MDENGAIAAAAEELIESGKADEAKVELARQGGESFPIFLFGANVFKDFFIDPASDLLSWSGVTYVIYLIVLAVPLWIWNVTYLWGKFSKLQRVGRMALGSGYGRRASRNAAAAGIRFLRKRFRNQILGRVGIFLIGLLVPIVNLMLLQSSLIYFAHYRYNKIVKGILAGFEAIGSLYESRGNPAALRQLGESYAGKISGSIVRAANVSGRLGDRFGDRARRGAQRLEGNVVRAARGRGGRVAAANFGESPAGRVPGGSARPSPQLAVDAANKNPDLTVA